MSPAAGLRDGHCIGGFRVFGCGPEQPFHA